MVSADIATPGQPTKAPRKGLLGAALGSIAPLLGLLLSPLFLVMAALSFDSGETPAAWLVAIMFVSMPLSCLILLIIGWVLFFLRRPTGALIAMLAPIAWVPIVIILFAVVMPLMH